MTAVPPSPLLPVSAAGALARCRELCFFDSARDGEVSFLFWDPVAVYTSRRGVGRLWQRGASAEPAEGDPFAALEALLERHPGLTAAGYWGYDLRCHVERLRTPGGHPGTRRAADDLELPDCRVGLYGPPAVYHHAEGRWSGTPLPPGSPPPPSARAHAQRAPGHPGTRPPAGVTADSLPRPAYLAAVRRVLGYIAAGDCYQVNLSRRLTVPYGGDPWSLYERLREESPAPYAAYLDAGDHQVLSSSPELFLAVREGEVVTRPIKGTRPRGATPEEDAALAAELISSAKDRAELLMIVDLERNDLGRVCEFGSVRVPELFRLESYRSVHHLVATVRGRLRPEVSPLACLRAAFPGGSITGAPKIRAMQIIDELEPVPRGVYTGAIGWVDGAGRGEWNIAIRTMVLHEGRADLSVGGAIVADSDPAAEHAETLAKADGMLRTLGIHEAGAGG